MHVLSYSVRQLSGTTVLCAWWPKPLQLDAKIVSCATSHTSHALVYKGSGMGNSWGKLQNSEITRNVQSQMVCSPGNQGTHSQKKVKMSIAKVEAISGVWKPTILTNIIAYQISLFPQTSSAHNTLEPALQDASYLNSVSNNTWHNEQYKH